MRKQLKLLACFFLLLPAQLTMAQFDKYFEYKTLRMDFYHCGDKENEEFYFDELFEEPYWGGSKTNLIDTMLYGNYYLNVYDATTDELIYSKGFSSLFWEWQTTVEATKIRKGCVETVVMPYPKQDVRIEITARNRQGKHIKKFEHFVDIDSYFIKKDRRLEYPTYEVLYSGAPARKVDIVLLPEGYTADEMEKFKADCHKFVEGLFSFSPFKERRNAFNVRAVLAPSAESGVDIPAENTWKTTLLNTSFYTFDSERYLMTFDNRSMRDLSANVPYDFIYIIANTQKYGGGAIYNLYGISVSGNIESAKVYVHEFCHLFAGLGDEYEGDVSYNDMYPTNVEPWEPNLTTLVDFDKKWKHLVKEGTPIPTPLNNTASRTVGAYEGGGYSTKGIYRAWPDCLMRTLVGNIFCPVCVEAIHRQIDFYTK